MAKPLGRLQVCNARKAAASAPPPDVDTLDDLLRACRALTRDPGLGRSGEAHQRMVRRARGARSAKAARSPDL